MTTRVEKSIMVNVPVSTAYNQWTQFEEFPQFMSGVKKVTQLGDNELEWVAEILGVRRQWKARVLEQVPDRKVAWAATEGATNAGAVTFEDVGGGQTSVHLSLEYEPHGFLEGLGEKLHLVENQAEGDLDRFKAFIESEGYATGAWRGSINEGGSVGTPGVEDAAASREDSGKAGVSGAAVAAGAAVLAGGVAAAAAAKNASDTSDSEDADNLYPPVGSTGDSRAPVEPTAYPAAGGQAGSPDTDFLGSDQPLTSAGASGTVYSGDAEGNEPLGGLDDLDTGEAARRRGDTFGGGVSPNPLS